MISGISNTTRKLPNRRRRGFTLLEILLVLVIIVIAFSMAIPAMRGPLATQRLRSGAEKIRIAWARARLKAVREGVTHAFYFAPGGNQFSVAAFGGDAPPPEFSNEENENPVPGNRENELPLGITFGDVQFGRDDRQAAMNTSTSQNPQSSTGETTDPILFYPDGTTASARLTVSSDDGQQIQINLRGLTGVARIGDPETVEER